jgi:branched-chain amino acid transport system substrate-binding protein
MRAFLSLSILIAAEAAAPALADPVRIAVIEDRAGSLGAQAAHSEQGFRLGLEYATKGTMSVGGRLIELIVYNNRGEPATAAKILAAAYRDAKVDLALSVGSSATALAMLPVAETHRKILIVARATANAITGVSWNRYVFRTGHNASQDALASVVAVGRPELNRWVLAQDTVDGRDEVVALKAALQQLPRGVFFVASSFVPSDQADIGGALNALLDDFHDLHGAKTLLTIWDGGRPPIEEIAALNPGRFGIRLALTGEIPPDTQPFGSRVAMEGVTSYFYSMPRNPANDWLVAMWRERFHERPDGFAASGMAAAMAVANALAMAGSADTEELIAAMEGMSFETPKGRMTFRKEDHQALQAMYYYRLESSPGLPELVHEISIGEIPLPIQGGP